MAWYDNLQYPDYAKHYENQGKIYSDLLNSLSKIGGEYLQKQREDVARKNMPTQEQFTKNYLEIMGKPATPAIPELYGAYDETREGVIPYITQRGQGALNAIEGSPARTEFDKSGYINALAKLMTGGNLEERNAAKDAYTVFGMQEQARKAGLPTYNSVDSGKDLYKIDPATGEQILVQKGVSPKKTNYYDINGNIESIVEGQKPSAGFFSKEYIDSLRKIEAEKVKLAAKTLTDKETATTLRTEKLEDRKTDKSEDANKEKIKTERENIEKEKTYLRSQIDKNNVVINKLSETKPTSPKQRVIDSLRVENGKLSTKLNIYNMGGGSKPVIPY